MTMNMDDSGTPASCLFIIGGGVAGRELARRLAVGWEIILLELDPPKGARLAESLGHRVRIEVGDGTSEVVLRRAGIERAESVIIATRDDEANKVAARLACEVFGRKQVLAVIGDESDPNVFRALGVETVSRGVAIGAAVEARLVPGRVTAVNIGLGQGELMEITLTPTSPIVGRPLRDSHGKAWRIGALYRGERLLVPAGHVIPEAGDRAVIVAPPQSMGALAELLAVGMTDFPGRYGWGIGVVFPRNESPGEASLALVSRFNAHGVVVFASGAPETQWSPPAAAGVTIARRESEDPIESALEAVIREELGMLIVPPPLAWGYTARGWVLSLGGTPARLRRLLDRVAVPVLFDRAESVATERPVVSRILLALLPGDTESFVIEGALELARTLAVPLSVVLAVPPLFISGTSHHQEADELAGRVYSLSRMYKVSCQYRSEVGNPVRAILTSIGEGDLVVVERKAGRSYSLFRPDVASQLVMRSAAPVVVFPVHDY